MPERSAGTHHIKSEQNVNMLLFRLECANFTVSIHCGVQGSHGTEGLFRQWINIDIWLDWCIRKNIGVHWRDTHSCLFYIYSRCEKYRRYDLKPLALFPHLKKNKSVTLAAGGNHHGKSAIQVKARQVEGKWAGEKQEWQCFIRSDV